METGPDGPATDVGGTITTNTTWTLAGSPYVVTSSVTVVDGVTLTIQPGVTVVMNPYTALAAEGVLQAAGTAVAPITFTAATPGATGEWYYLQIGGGNANDSDASQLSYVTIEGGGVGGNPALYITTARLPSTTSPCAAPAAPASRSTGHPTPSRWPSTPSPSRTAPPTASWLTTTRPAASR